MVNKEFIQQRMTHFRRYRESEKYINEKNHMCFSISGTMCQCDISSKANFINSFLQSTNYETVVVDWCDDAHGSGWHESEDNYKIASDMMDDLTELFGIIYDQEVLGIKSDFYEEEYIEGEE